MAQFRQIARIQLGDLASALAEKGIELTWNDFVADLIAEKSFSEKFGARNLRRFMQTAVEDRIAAKIIDSYQSRPAAVRLTVEDGQLGVELICEDK